MLPVYTDLQGRIQDFWMGFKFAEEGGEGVCACVCMGWGEVSIWPLYNIFSKKSLWKWNNLDSKGGQLKLPYTL